MLIVVLDFESPEAAVLAVLDEELVAPVDGIGGAAYDGNVGFVWLDPEVDGALLCNGLKSAPTGPELEDDATDVWLIEENINFFFRF